MNSFFQSIPRHHLLILLLVLLVLVFVGWSTFALPAVFFLTDEYTLLTESQPTDRELIKIFEENREELEQLRQMAMEDGAKGESLRIDCREKSTTDYVNFKGISMKRQNAYRNLLFSIKPSPILLIIPNHYVNFSLADGGLGPLGVDWNKGIRYIKDDPEKEGVILKDLDKAKKGDGDELLRQIDQHWFVYYESY